MATKRLVLEILERNRGQNISGEYIANLLGLSRNMVWRAIGDLRNDGYVIEAVTSKGYRLTGENDILSAEGIRPFLAPPDIAKSIEVYAEIDSTNREAKTRAVARAPHGAVILANRQASGKGRHGKDFYSPSDSGLYMSFVLHSDILGFSNPTAITAYAALSVCEAIESVCNLSPKIKWVNDIFLGGKKICGILTEAITEIENQSVREIVLGIGVNVSTRPQDFPETLREIAGSLYPDGNAQITRNRLAAEIINRVLRSDGPGGPDEARVFEGYRARLFMLGADVAVTQGDESYIAKALDIDEHGYLIVEKPSGELITLSSGEIKLL